jgi:hypothetical protein
VRNVWIPSIDQRDIVIVRNFQRQKIMNRTERIQFTLKSQHSFEFLRELELRKLITEGSDLEDVVKLFSYKLAHTQQNENVTLTIIQDLLWAILTALWDNDYLISKQDILVKLNRIPAKSLVDSNSNEIETPTVKDNELKNAFETIISLRGRIKELEQERNTHERIHTRNEQELCDVGAQADRSDLRPGQTVQTLDIISFDSPSDKEETSSASHMDLEKLKTSFVLSGASNQKKEAREPEEPMKVAQGQMPLYKDESDGHRLDSADETRAETRGSNFEREVEDALTEGMARKDDDDSSSRRLALLRERGSINLSNQHTIKEVELMIQREIEDEYRINEFLSEIVEKDELIEKMLTTLRNLTNKPRGSTSAPTNRLVAPLVMKEMESSVSDFLEEKTLEILELRAQNDALKVMVSSLESDNKLLSKRIEIMGTLEVQKTSFLTRETHDESSQISQRSQSCHDENLIDSPTQTDGLTVVLTTRRGPDVLIENSSRSSSSEEALRLSKSLEEEKEKTRKATEETKRVKFCLNELERQLAALQFQLRRSGVKQEYIQTALQKSGLTSLMRASRAAVFERLYQDALDRVSRMEKIRQEVHEMQSKYYMRRFTPVSGDRPTHNHPQATNNLRIHILGGGFLADRALANQLSPVRYHGKPT